MIALILYFALALSLSFLCSLLEAVLLSVTHAYVGTLQIKKPKSGHLLKTLKDRIDRPLAAILTLNTVSHTIGAAGVGAQVQVIFDQTWALSAASVLLTLAILIFSEIIPKTLGAVHWRKLAPAAAYITWAIIWPLSWVVYLLELISRMISPKIKHLHFSRDEMLAAVEIGHIEGTLLPQESRIIRNLFLLQNIRAKDILTPRSVLLALQKDKTVSEALERNNPIRFSRIPVYGKDLDDIYGLVHRHQIMQAFSKGQADLKLESISAPVYAIPETKPVADVLDEFIKRREHLFLVVDEYGGTSGIITLEDTIETLLGVEIVDEFDTVEDMRKWAKQRWERRKKRENTPD